MELAPAGPAMPPPAAPPGNDIVRPPRPPIFAPLAGGWLRRLGFRFLALFFAIFVLTRSLSIVPGLTWLAVQINKFWRNATPWFGREVMHLKQPAAFVVSGSGDKLFDWVQITAMLALALLGALVWVWFDRARRWDGWVDDLMRTAVRYSLGTTMLSYGMAKILYQQMPAPGSSVLLETYGESSPMRLAWTFMGQSWAYSAFAGGLEFLGGVLLFFRRTATLGALVLVAVMTNVFLMNLCFDIPVKLYSGIYLFMASVLAAPAAGRLWSVLIAHRATAAAPSVAIARPWPTGRAGRLLTVVKVLMVLQILWVMVVQRTWTWLETLPVRSELFGLYEVESFMRNGETRAPLLTDTLRWRRIGIDERNLMTLVMMDDRRIIYRVRLGSEPGKLTIEIPTSPRSTTNEDFTFSHPTPDRLVLEGRLNGAQLSVQLKRTPETRLLLTTRGFHWVSEYPNNR
jgi:hypothetical protein